MGAANGSSLVIKSDSGAILGSELGQNITLSLPCGAQKRQNENFTRESPNFFYSIGAGIIASVLFSWLLDPLTKWIWHTATLSASSWLTGLQNAAFRNAALGKRDWVSALMFTYGTSAFMGLLFGFVIGMVRHALGRGAKRSRRGPTFRLVGLFFVVAFSTYFLYRFACLNFLAYVDLQLNASFSQRLDALSPYIDSLEERRLRSSWALMTCRKDYDLINGRLNELAIDAKITIPKPLYP